jgi:hypothetical protein
MTYTVICDSTDRASWLAARTLGVTATDVARLARGGAKTWGAIRAEKAGKGRDFMNAAMQHGRDREPKIIQFAAKQFGVEPFGKLVAADDEPKFLATPDAIGPVVAEVKTTVHDWLTLSDVPGRYIDQTLWQMRVTGIHRAVLLFEPHENGVPIYPFPKHFDVDYDQARVAHLESVAYEFLNSTDEPDEDAAVLDALLTDAAMRKEVADAAARSYQEAVSAIEEYLGGKPRQFEGSLATLTRSADGVSNTFATAEFKKTHPDVYADFVRQSPRKGALRITLRTDEEKTP